MQYFQFSSLDSNKSQLVIYKSPESRLAANDWGLLSHYTNWATS